MEIIGLDLHQRERQRSIKADDGAITDRRIATSRERITALFGERPPGRILLKASTESEWVARHLESLGHEMIVPSGRKPPSVTSRCWCGFQLARDPGVCRHATMPTTRLRSPVNAGWRQ